MVDGLAGVPVKALFAIMAISACCIMSTINADSPTLSPGQFVKFHIEATLACVEVTVTGWKKRRKEECDVTKSPEAASKMQ